MRGRFDEHPGRLDLSNEQTTETDMFNFIKNFRKDENGAVTVDWVVLTAAVVGLAIAAYTAIETNADALITAAGDAVGDQDDFTTE
jgi:Flp pilus assembly pilin Flp